MIKLDANFFEKLEQIWPALWELVDKLLKILVGEDYMAID